MAIAAIASAVFAAVALAVAVRAKEIAETANNVAKTGNGLAQTANDTAADALDEARRANEFADEANRFSDEANTIAERALRAAQDDVPYKWVLKVDDNGVAVVINDCGHHAHLATVTLESAGQVVAESGPIDVASFGKITLDAKSILDQHFAEVSKNPAVYARTVGGIFFTGHAGDPVSITFRAHLRWQTDQGLPRNDVVREVLQHQMTYDGLERFEGRRRKGTAED